MLQLDPEVVVYNDLRRHFLANDVMFIIHINSPAAVLHNLQLFGANIGHGI